MKMSDERITIEIDHKETSRITDVASLALKYEFNKHIEETGILGGAFVIEVMAKISAEWLAIYFWDDDKDTGIKDFHACFEFYLEKYIEILKMSKNDY